MGQQKRVMITASPSPPSRGAYEIDGVRYPRVTTITGVIARPGLEAWRQKVGLEEAARISNEAAALGTAVHALCEQIDLDRLTAVSDALRPYVTAYLDWKAAHVREVLAVERLVVHRAHQYAGTLDRLFLMTDGRRMVWDFKTGKTVDGIARLQQIAYVEALEYEGEQVDGRGILHLPSNAPGVLHPFELDDTERDRKAWRACLRLYRWYERHKDDWKATGTGRNGTGSTGDRGKGDR